MQAGLIKPPTGKLVPWCLNGIDKCLSPPPDDFFRQVHFKMVNLMEVNPVLKNLALRRQHQLDLPLESAK